MIGLVAEYLISNGNKLGVDLDDVTEFQLLKAFFNAKYLFPDKVVRVFRSSNGKGYHVIVYGVKSTLKVREMLCDCEQRREYSEFRSGLRGMVTGDEVVDDVMFGYKFIHTKSGELIERKRDEISEWNLMRRRQW